MVAQNAELIFVQMQQNSFGEYKFTMYILPLIVDYCNKNKQIYLKLYLTNREKVIY